MRKAMNRLDLIYNVINRTCVGGLFKHADMKNEKQNYVDLYILIMYVLVLKKNIIIGSMMHDLYY